MKIKVEDTEFEHFGSGKSQEFDVDLSGKIFDILSDNLYVNKIGSVVREICSNCYDAHTSVGKTDVPFAITLPTTFKSTISFRDFGPGISKEDVFKNYSSYGKSTKSDDNNQIGGYGIGSKSPLCYTKSFTVISIHKSVKSVYNIAKANRGVPVITELSSMPTTEPDGFEVIIPVQKQDYNEFKEEIANQLIYFKVKPTIQEGYIHWKNLTPLYESPEHSIYEGQPFQPDRNHFDEMRDFIKFMSPMNSTYNPAMMMRDWPKGETLIYFNVGNFIYPIDLNKLGGSFKNLSVNTIVFNVGIGNVSLTANRESIAYNPETISFIRNLLEKTEKDIINELDVFIDGIDEYIVDSHKKYTGFIKDMIKHNIRAPYSQTTRYFDHVTNKIDFKSYHKKNSSFRSKISYFKSFSFYNDLTFPNLPFDYTDRQVYLLSLKKDHVNNKQVSYYNTNYGDLYKENIRNLFSPNQINFVADLSCQLFMVHESVVKNMTATRLVRENLLRYRDDRYGIISYNFSNEELEKYRILFDFDIITHIDSGAVSEISSVEKPSDSYYIIGNDLSVTEVSVDQINEIKTPFCFFTVKPDFIVDGKVSAIYTSDQESWRAVEITKHYIKEPMYKNTGLNDATIIIGTSTIVPDFIEKHPYNKLLSIILLEKLGTILESEGLSIDEYHHLVMDYGYGLNNIPTWSKHVINAKKAHPDIEALEGFKTLKEFFDKIQTYKNIKIRGVKLSKVIEHIQDVLSHKGRIYPTTKKDQTLMKKIYDEYFLLTFLNKVFEKDEKSMVYKKIYEFIKNKN